MAKAWRTNNLPARRAVALQILRNAKFTPTDRKGNERSEEKWRERVAQEIATLEGKLRL